MTVVAGTPGRWLLRGWRGLLRVVGWVLLTAYSLLVRFAVAIGAVWGLLYFLIASQPFKHFVETLVSRSIPGAITCATVRWGPSPWQISVTEGRIHGAHGETIIAVRGVRTQIDMGRTLLGLLRFIDDSSNHPFPLYADFAEVVGGFAYIRLDEAGNVGIIDAFVIFFRVSYVLRLGELVGVVASGPSATRMSLTSYMDVLAACPEAATSACEGETNRAGVRE